MKEKLQPRKTLLEVISLMRVLAEIDGKFQQTTILPYSLAKWLADEGKCEVWYAGNSEFHTVSKNSSENFLWLVLYEHPYPGTFSEELYKLACKKQDRDWALKTYYPTSHFSEDGCSMAE